MSEKSTTLKQQTFSGFIWRLAERLCAQVVSFVITVVLARILMPSEYGVVAIVNAFIVIADVLISSSFSIALIQKKEADELDFSTAFYASLVMAALLYALLFFCAPLISRFYKNESLVLLFRIMGLKFFISAVNSVQQAYVSRQMIFRKFFFATLSGTVLSGVAGIVLALNGAGVWALVVQLLTNPFIDTIILFITVRWHPRFLFSFERLKSLFDYGWKIMLSYLAGTLFHRLNSLVVGKKYSAADLAYYNRGESLPKLVTSSISSTIESVLFPAISKVQDDRQKMKTAVRRAVSLGSFIIMPMLFGFAAVSARLIVLLFTQKWAPAIPFVQIVCLEELTTLLSNINLQSIKACGRSDTLLKIEFIKKPVFLVVIILAARVSPICLALSTAIYSFFALFIDSIPNKKLIDYSFFEQLCDVKNSFFMSAIMGAAVWGLGKIALADVIVLPLQIVLGVGVYTGLCVIFKNPDFYYLKALLKERFNSHSE